MRPVREPEARQPDGRVARATRSRTAVADALLALYEAGRLRPTAAEIAERAGVSVRLVHHHFNDREALVQAAADRQNERTAAAVRAIDIHAPRSDRLDAFARERARLLEQITPVRRAATLEAPFSPAIAHRLRVFRKLKREQAWHVFARELERVPAPRRPAVRGAVAAAASWASWEELRVHQGLSVAAARDAMLASLDALLPRARGRRAS